MEEYLLTNKEFCGLFQSIYSEKEVKNIKIQAHGNSMAPFLKHGQTIRVKPISTDKGADIGDIVAAVMDNKEKIIVHRVINKKPNYVQLKGDNCRNTDGWFHYNRICGIVEQNFFHNKIIDLDKVFGKLIAGLSKNTMLNIFILPFGRRIKKVIKSIY